MDEYYSCFCGKTFDKQEMKSSHFRDCQTFKNKFKGLDEKLSRSIKKFVENLDKLNYKDYVDGLLLLKFFLKRYVNLIGDLITKNIKKNDHQYNKVSSQFKNNVDINIIQKSESSNLDNIKEKKRDNSPELSVVRNFTNSDKNFIGIGNNKDKTFEKIINYCEKVYKKDTNFDEELLNIMSYSLSALTSKECFLVVSNDNQNKRLITRSDDKRKFYGFKYKDTDFFVLLY